MSGIIEFARSVVGGLYNAADTVAAGYLPGGVPTQSQQIAELQGRVASNPFAGGGSTGGMAAAAGVARPRGKLMTAVAKVYPDGSIEPVSQTAGRPLLMSSDLTAVKRALRVSRDLNRRLPKRRSIRKAPVVKGKTSVLV